MPESSSQPQPATEPKSPLLPRVVQAEELLRGAQEVVIEHAGARYRLRLTRRNKLILQK